MAKTRYNKFPFFHFFGVCFTSECDYVLLKSTVYRVFHHVFKFPNVQYLI